jgi:hypothetical protein
LRKSERKERSEAKLHVGHGTWNGTQEKIGDDERDKRSEAYVYVDPISIRQQKEPKKRGRNFSKQISRND